MEIPLSPFTPEPKYHPVENLMLKYRFWILGGLMIVFGFGIYLMLTPPTATLANGDTKQSADSPEQATQSSGTQIVVDIAGGVNQPGVYLLPTGVIVEDAIKQAGGFSRLADMDAIAKTVNRASIVDAHSKIYIPKRGDNLAMITSASASQTASTTSATTKININTATATELDILPGVGPVTAQRIIDYRIQNGDFQNIDEIKNVPGLGDAKFDALKDLITT